MRCVRFVTLLLLASQLVSTNVSAAIDTIDDTFVVEYEPERLTLKPDEKGTVTFEIENIGNETLTIAFRFTRTKSGSTVGEFYPSSTFDLAPGSSERVVVTVETRADYGQDPGASDFKVTMYWGKDLVVDEEGKPDEYTADGRRSYRLAVTDDFSETDRSLILLVAIVLLIVIALVIWRPRKRPTTAVHNVDLVADG